MRLKEKNTLVPHATVLAYMMLPLVVPATIMAFSRWRAAQAFLFIYLGSILFLPERIAADPPLIPPIDKYSLPLLCLVIGAAVSARRQLKSAHPGRGVDLLIVAMLVGAAGTVLTNRDPLVYVKTVLPGYAATEVVSEVWRVGVYYGIPFFLGRTLFRTTEDAKQILRAFVIGGLCYTPFILVELRMSPQIHNWVYGFTQNSFEQTRRADGWRPTVFMIHGLALALFMWAAMAAAWALRRQKTKLFGIPPTALALGLTVVVFLINSLGAQIYALVGIPLLLFLRPKTLLTVAVLLAGLAASYPVLRATGTFPREAIANMATDFNQERGLSLDFRFTNEELLVVKALERPTFGWGGYQRTFVFDDRGQAFSVPDGEWVITLGARGIFGLVAEFLALLVPILMARRRVNRLPPASQVLLASLALMAVVYTIDLLPNGMFNSVPMFLSGAVAGLSQGMSASDDNDWRGRVIRAWLAVRAAAAARRGNPWPTA